MTGVINLTPERVAMLVAGCLGVVPVLAIVGPCGSGKTVSLRHWAQAAREADNLRVAYVDNHSMMIRDRVEVSTGQTSKDVAPGHYPMFDLEGVDVVIVDEPLQNRELVTRLLAHTHPAKGPFMHRLLVLPVQQAAVLALLEIPRSAMRVYGNDGTRLDKGRQAT
jgi:hypothetical protein